MAGRCVVPGPPRLSSSSCLLAWFHENLVSKRDGFEAGSDLKAATQHLRTWGPSLWICLRDLRWNYGDWDPENSIGLARPHLHACDRPIAITQPAIERVVEMLLQVEGFESEVRGLRKLCFNWVIWGLGSLKKRRWLDTSAKDFWTKLMRLLESKMEWTKSCKWVFPKIGVPQNGKP